jgi:predicted transcriptional regulator of viral defense system
LLKITIIRNKTTYQAFRQELIEFQVFSLADARKAFPGFDSRRLVEWQDKQYIIKLTNKWYLFKEAGITELLLYRISNCLHAPSYISLQSALSYFNLIPEGVYSYLAVCTSKTITYTTAVGAFQYRTVKPSLYFGYRILEQSKFPVLMADPAKAILDLLYLSPELRSVEDLAALRLNIAEFKSMVQWKTLTEYAQLFNSPVLNKRISWLKKIVYADAS